MMSARVEPVALGAGHMLSWYRIDDVVGAGGFGVTYRARDTNLDAVVAVKEYVPASIATRRADGTLRATLPDDASLYDWGLERFVLEARTLAKFDHPNIVRVRTVFEANRTAYMIMDYERGDTLAEWLRREPARNDEATLCRLIAPILDGLSLVHFHGFIHRDIKPANILVRVDGTPVLLDFGSARRSSGGASDELTSLVSAGYAPLEQYQEAGDTRQGAWTDIHALGAVLHFAILGQAPADSPSRGAARVNDRPDPYHPLAERGLPGYGPRFLEAVDWALSLRSADRPQSISQWKARLLGDDSTVIMTRQAVEPNGDERARARGTAAAPASRASAPDDGSMGGAIGGAADGAEHGRSPEAGSRRTVRERSSRVRAVAIAGLLVAGAAVTLSPRFGRDGGGDTAPTVAGGDPPTADASAAPAGAEVAGAPAAADGTTPAAIDAGVPTVEIPWIAPSDAPTIDGLYDAIWNGAVFNSPAGERLSIDNLLAGHDANRADGATEYKWGALHDGLNLYIMVFGENVPDATVHGDSADPADDDAVHVLIDADAGGAARPDGVDDRHLVLPLLMSDSPVEANNSRVADHRLATGDASPPLSGDIEFVACVCQRGQHTWELRLPLASIDVRYDRTFGIDVWLDDDIDGGTVDARWGWASPSPPTAPSADRAPVPSPAVFGVATLK